MWVVGFEVGWPVVERGAWAIVGELAWSEVAVGERAWNEVVAGERAWNEVVAGERAWN